MYKAGKKQKDSEQSAIVNQDAEFENSDVDPGFVFEEAKEQVNIPDTDNGNVQEEKKDAEPDEQGTHRSDPGLGELDGTNPGSNHHPMDENTNTD